MDETKAEFGKLNAEIAEKEAQVRAQDELLKQERERRGAENGEIRNLLYQEQDKSLQAAREAEKYATEIRMHQERTNRAELDLDRKQAQVDDLQQKLFATNQGKNSAHESLLFKFENQKHELEERHRDEVSSMQLKLNNRDSDLHKME